MNTQNSQPLSLDEAAKQYVARGPKKKAKLAIERRFHLAAEAEPKVKTKARRMEGGGWEIAVEIDGIDVTGRSAPPMMKGTAVKESARRVSEGL